MHNTINRLDAVHSQLSSLISGLDADTLAKRPGDNEWSVADVIHHLYLVEDRVVKELRRKLAQPAENAGFLKSLIPMQIISWRFIRVKAPKAVVPEGFNNVEESLKNWETSRARLKQICDDPGAARLKHTVLKHPLLGNISGVAAISMVAFHEQRHYKQIKEILKKLGS